MLSLVTHRPRNVNAARAAGLLYGDWGTSKAYVIGLAFAIAGYASFWLILGVSLLSLLVSICYTFICRCFPNGGGVYASVRRRSEATSIVGALFLFADYLVTAALSALSAFYYFQVSDPVLYAGIFIIIIGLFNYFGPRHTGSVALIIGLAAFVVFTLLALSSLPFLAKAWHNIQPIKGSPLSAWAQFCSLIVAMSGIETIANSTGVMKLNKGASKKKPVVTQTATPAIIWVMLEVIIFTSLFGFAAAAISGFQFSEGTVSIPGFPDVRDYMLRYLGIIFGTSIAGATIGNVFGWVISVVVGLLLLSAVNTAMSGLISLQYLMASDNELPSQFKKVNSFGIPYLPLILTALIPMILVVSLKNVADLADLYAVGFVGAIAMNLASTATDFTLPLRRWERVFMLFVALVMTAIEITLLIDKPKALLFVVIIMIVGLSLRWITKRAKKEEVIQLPSDKLWDEPFREGAMLCVVTELSKALKTAVAQSNESNTPLNILFVHEQEIISEKDLEKRGATDKKRERVIQYVRENANLNLVRFHYSVTDSLVDIAVAYALHLDVHHIIIEKPKEKWLQTLRGKPLRHLLQILPSGIRLTIS